MSNYVYDYDIEEGLKVNFHEVVGKPATEFLLTVWSERSFELGREQCVWLEEKPYPVRLSALSKPETGSNRSHQVQNRWGA